MDGSLTGKLLIAMPGIGDPRFEKCVIVMCMHTPEAAMGLVVNKIKEDLTLGDVLEALGEDRQPPQAYVLALGYAGWGAGQLENELHGNVWLVADFERGIIFDDAHDKKWTRAIRTLGIDPSMLTGESGRA